MTHAACEMMWIQSFLHEIDVFYNKPIMMHCDNQAVMDIVNNNVFYERTKRREIGREREKG